MVTDLLETQDLIRSQKCSRTELLVNISGELIQSNLLITSGKEPPQKTKQHTTEHTQSCTHTHSLIRGRVGCTVCMGALSMFCCVLFCFLWGFFA